MRLADGGILFRPKRKDTDISSNGKRIKIETNKVTRPTPCRRVRLLRPIDQNTKIQKDQKTERLKVN